MKSFAQKYPVLLFLLITFGWTWLFWLAAIPLRGQTLLVTAIVLIGGYGPFIGGILTLGLKSGLRFSLPLKQLVTMLIAAAVIFGVLTLRYLVGNRPNYGTLAADLTLSVPIVLAALAASLVGGWAISSAVSSNLDVRKRMATLLPWRLPVGWTLLAIVFYPAMILVAWGVAVLIGAKVEYPGLWGRPAMEVLPLFALSFCLTALAQGGNEEPGWRGLLQPTLQKRFSPLVAALIVALLWSLWHLPLFLNGFYPEDLVSGMVSGAIFRVLLAIFLAWFYNRSGGNLFLMIILHTSFNGLVKFLPTYELGLIVLWLLVTVVVVVKDKMWRKLPEDAPIHVDKKIHVDPDNPRPNFQSA